jgi:hypothetical protein
LRRTVEFNNNEFYVINNVVLEFLKDNQTSQKHHYKYHNNAIRNYDF